MQQNTHLKNYPACEISESFLLPWLWEKSNCSVPYVLDTGDMFEYTSYSDVISEMSFLHYVK